MDMSATVAPKSDQMNADDLIAGPRVVTITDVKGCPSPDQPVAVHFDGDNGKPYKPCKSMRRVMIAMWGPDAKAYPGRSMRLYCDPEVAFGGMKVGGIRISHMSHIERDAVLALTATKASRKPYTVRVLAVEKPAAPPTPPAPEVDEAMIYARDLCVRVRAAKTLGELEGITAEPDVIAARARLADGRPKLADRVTAAVNEMIESLDDFPGTMPGDKA